MSVEAPRRGLRALAVLLGVQVLLLLVFSSAKAEAAPFHAEQVVDLQSNASYPAPSGGEVLDGELIYAASDAARGVELWRTDGTVEGTTLIRDILPGKEGSYPGYFARAGGLVFFYAGDGSHGTGLWVTDGTTEGTKMIKDIDDVPPHNYGYRYVLNVGGTIYFDTWDDATGRELWKSDGTSAGTVLVKDINPGTSSSFPGGLVGAGGVLYFKADDGTHGYELWRSDGTQAGTTMVKDATPGSGGNPIAVMWNVGGEVYFGTAEGLWRSDGTESGTFVVKDFPHAPFGVTDFEGVAFFAVDDGSHGDELWRSDGSEAGTSLVKDINPGSGGGNPSGFTVVGDRLLFVADDGVHGHELWMSDGTEVGTTLVKDVNPGPASGLESLAATVSDRTFFRGDDGSHGVELWESDGTPEGTGLVVDANPGPEGGYPLGMTALGGSLLFGPYDGADRTLWRADPGPDTDPPDTVVNSGPADGAATKAPIFHFRGTPGDTAELQCQVDFAGFTDCESPIDLSSLQDGPHTLSVRAVDASRNVDRSPSLRTFTFDTVPPETTIDRPLEGATVPTDGPTFEFSGSPGDGDGFQCKLDGGAYSGCASPLWLHSLADGDHELAVQAIDAAGNVDPTPAVRNFVVDTSFRPLKRGRQELDTGTAFIYVQVPGPGLIELDPTPKSAGLVEHAELEVAADDDFSAGHGVRLKPTPRGKRLLTKRAKGPGPGVLEVSLVVTYTPTGGSPHAQRQRYKLKMR